MDPELWRKVEQLYHAALEMKEGERAAFLDCVEDAALRKEVESLLALAADADGYLRAVVGEVAAQAAAGNAADRTTLPVPAGVPQKLGRYELIEKIGAGGMGVVYRAKDPAIGRVVAIKTILLDKEAGNSSELRALMVRESQAAGRLTHPNIVTIHDFCQDDDASYIVMEFVQGRTLDSVMRGNPALPSSVEVLQIVQECAAALDYAHSRGVVHRDIKPANIMLQDDGVVKIADFGIARVTQFSGLTQTLAPRGSPAFMAPEQWHGRTVTGKADQYALATVAYLLLTGRQPFEGDSVPALAAMALYQDPPAATSFNPTLNPAVDRVLRRALAKNGEARYPTCGEFAAELGRAWDPGAASGPIRGNRRKLVVAAIFGALALALAGGLLLFHRGSDSTIRSSVESAHAPAPVVSSPPSEDDPELRAEALLKQSDYAGAVQYFTKAIATKPDYASYFGRATGYRQLDQMNQAVNDYSEAIRYKPSSALAFHDRGFCKMRLGLADAAAADFDKSLALDPSNPRAWYDRGTIRLKKGGYKHAIECFTKAIELDPNFAPAWENRAVAERKLQQTEAADADLKHALALRQRQDKP